MKILDLLNKLAAQFSNLNPSDQLNDIISNKLKTVKSSTYIESIHINARLANDVIKAIKNFKNQFLINQSTEEKTSEPHEKSG